MKNPKLNEIKKANQAHTKTLSDFVKNLGNTLSENEMQLDKVQSLESNYIASENPKKQAGRWDISATVEVRAFLARKPL